MMMQRDAIVAHACPGRRLNQSAVLHSLPAAMPSTGSSKRTPSMPGTRRGRHAEEAPSMQSIALQTQAMRGIGSNNFFRCLHAWGKHEHICAGPWPGCGHYATCDAGFGRGHAPASIPCIHRHETRKQTCYNVHARADGLGLAASGCGDAGQS